MTYDESFTFLDVMLCKSESALLNVTSPRPLVFLRTHHEWPQTFGEFWEFSTTCVLQWDLEQLWNHLLPRLINFWYDSIQSGRKKTETAEKRMRRLIKMPQLPSHNQWNKEYTVLLRLNFISPSPLPSLEVNTDSCLLSDEHIFYQLCMEKQFGLECWVFMFDQCVWKASFRVAPMKLTWSCLISKTNINTEPHANTRQEFAPCYPLTHMTTYMLFI